MDDRSDRQWYRARGSARSRQAAELFFEELTARPRLTPPVRSEAEEDCGCGGKPRPAESYEDAQSSYVEAAAYESAEPESYERAASSVGEWYGLEGDEAELALEREPAADLRFGHWRESAAPPRGSAALDEGEHVEAALDERAPFESPYVETSVVHGDDDDDDGFGELEADEGWIARPAEGPDDEDEREDEGEPEYVEAALGDELAEAAPFPHHCFELTAFRSMDLSVDGDEALVTAPTATTPPEFSQPAPTRFRTIAGLDANFVAEEEPAGPPNQFFTSTRGRALLDTGHFRVDPGNAAQFQVRLRGLVCHPSDAATPTRLPSGTERFPVVILVHGNHAAVDFAFADSGRPRTTRVVGGVTETLIPGRASVRHEVFSYRGYRDLQEHLARLGIVSVSIDHNAANETGSLIRFRADLVLELLDHLRSLDTTPGGTFSGRLDLRKVGLVGHSRGGDAVAMAAQLNAARPDATKHGVKAVVTIAPTDFTGMLAQSARLRMVPGLVDGYLSMYGSHDGDVSGKFFGLLSQGWGFTGTGFRHYDRATTQRAMVFIHGATHNRFNQVWITPAEHAAGSPARRLAESQADNSDDEPEVDPRKPPSSAFPLPAANRDARVLSDAAHRTLLREFCGGWLELWLLGRVNEVRRFNGTIANSLGVPVGLQWKVGRALRTVDNFDDSNPARNVSGGGITLPPFVAEQLVEVSDLAQTPHNDRGLRALPPTGAARVYRTELAASARDWSGLDTLTFRFSKRFPTVSSPGAIAAAAFPPNFELALFDGTNRRSVDQTVIAPLNPRTVRPYYRVLAGLNLTKVHLQTWQVPLSAFAGVSLSSIVAVEISFNASAGEPIHLDTLSVVRV